MKYFVKTFGCQMNESDSERIAGFLENKGYKKAPDIKGADLIVVNACSVRQSAIDRIFGLEKKFQKLKTQNPKLKIILTGCVLKSDKRKFEKYFDKVLNINDFLGKDYFCINPNHFSKNSAFVPIMTGCDNFCTYCVVPYTRGRETSRPVKEIINEAKILIKKGYKEIALLGQNVNSYKYGFAKLLKKLNTLPGNFKIKFITNHPKDFSDELINVIAKCKKIAKEIHLPIQSGDDKVLKKMNRGYTVRQYKNLVKKIQKKIPNVKLSTDVIVGFPGESKKQFENTVKLFKEIKFDVAYINKYSPRIGTAAAKLKDSVSWQEKKKRWNVLNEIINKNNLIVVLGPTATGKSDLAVKIAKEFNGEIISADSRQIYKEMNIGTGKITKKEMKDIPHYLLDIINPKKQITVAEYRKKALEAIDKICKKDSPPHQYIGGGGKVPILCGGTGFYIRAVAEGIAVPEVKPDSKLRKELENKTTKELFKQLKKLDPQRAKKIDLKNHRRLIRAIEIVLKSGKTVPEIKRKPQFRVLYLGIKKPLPELKKAIDKRVDKMIKNGLEKEVKKLVKKYGWTQILKNAIGYSSFIKDTEDKAEIINDIKLRTFQFAKRQLTWYKKYPGTKVHWISNYQQAKKLLREFMQSPKAQKPKTKEKTPVRLRRERPRNKNLF